MAVPSVTHLPVVQHQRGDVTFGINPIEVSAVGAALGAVIDADQFERQIQFPQNDMWREGAGIGRKIEFHRHIPEAKATSLGRQNAVGAAGRKIRISETRYQLSY
jgi:hypothetical protein